MKNYIFGAAIGIICMAGTAQAQYDNYPALFGRQTSFGGTARYAAIGGAATALGADLGTATVNPAGLAMYRKSEFSFSPNFGSSGSNSDFLGASTHDNKGSFSISNLGIAICGNKGELETGSWRGGTFSLSMSRTNSFHNRISFAGTDNQTSMADYFVEQANGTPSGDFDAQSPTDPNGTGIYSLPALAYWAFLIDPLASGNTYTNYLQSSERFNKDATYTTKGAQYQWNIAYGANYKDKLYIGGGLGITSINYREDLTYTEVNDYSNNSNDSTFAFDNFTFNDYNKVKGTGVNFKLGYIYKVSDAFRIGSTVTTPTYYWMNQEYSSDLTVVYPSYLYDGTGSFLLGTQSYNTVPSYFKFNYTTPVKLAMGMAVFAGKAGFVSADMEYIPYQLSSLGGRNSSDDKFLKPYNRSITNSYLNVLNLKLGAEIRADILRIRLGGAYLPSPYKSNDNVDRNVYQITGGLGVKLENVNVDLGIVNTRYQSSYTPYSLSEAPDRLSGDPSYASPPKAVSKNSMLNVVLTMSFFFE